MLIVVFLNYNCEKLDFNQIDELMKNKFYLNFNYIGFSFGLF